MLSKLTKKQEAAMATHAQYWINRSLECRPADRNTAVRGIRSYYRIAKLEEPKRIVWVPNPLVLVMAGPIAASLVGDVNAVDVAVDFTMSGAVNIDVDRAVANAVAVAVDAVRNVVDDAVYSSVDVAVRDVVDFTVSGAVDRAVAADRAVIVAIDRAVAVAVSSVVNGAVDYVVRDAVRDAITDDIHDEVTCDVNGAVDHAVHDTHDTSDSINYLGGMFWSAWPAAYGTFFRDHCGLDIAKEALQAAEDVTECGWWWPHKEFVMICERPECLKRNYKGELHSLHGPAIAWPGFELYFVNGQRIPEEWKHSLQEAELMQRLGNAL